MEERNRGYKTLWVTLGITGLMAMIVLFRDPNQTSFILGYWKDLVMILVPAVIGAKEGGKYLAALSAKKAKKEGDG